MRVSFILPAYYNFPIGGYKVIFEHANFLSSRGHEVCVYFPRNISLNSVRSAYKRIGDALWAIKTRKDNQPLIGWQSISPAVRLSLVGRVDRHTIRDADAIVATAWQTAAGVSELPNKKGRKMYLVQDHEVWRGVAASQVDATFRLNMRVIAVSRWLVEMATERGSNDVFYVPNGLDHDQFRIIRPVSSRAPAVMSLYHHDERKGVPVAIAALEILHQARPDVHISMFGVPEPNGSLPDWISYDKAPSRDRLVQLYNRSTIFLSASYVEGWSLPSIEAMACGCVLVCTDSKGPRDFAKHNLSALMSETGNAGRLAANLLRVISEPDLQTRLQRAGTQAAQEFTWAKSGCMFEQALY